VYHLFYADETGDPGSDITFFEYPGAHQGRAGAGMVHRVVWRVSSPESLDFWSKRLASQGYESSRPADLVLRFADFEGLEHELVVIETGDEPLIAEHPEIPAELAIQGFDSVRAYTADPGHSRAFLQEALGFEPVATDIWEVRGERRGGHYRYDPAPPEPGIQGAGSVHHVAWASPPADHEAWRKTVTAAGARATPIIDRYYFRSIYFREPSGVLFEIATIGPGFTVDEPLEQLGHKLSLTPQYEHLREQIEPTLTPIHNPRDSWARQ
jgi:glyoxalase family protein